jgi:hypothetical protein
MSEPKDFRSMLTLRALDLLLMKHPARTSLGIVLGLVFSLFAAVFSPMLSRAADYVDISKVAAWQWIPLGILCAHVPTLLGFMFTRPVSDEGVDEAIRMIKRGPLSEIEQAMLYRMLTNAVLQRIAESSAKADVAEDPKRAELEPSSL